MLNIISGEKGKGKTIHLLERANKIIKEAEGNVVYLDKSSKNMYELHNKIRLINTSEYNYQTADGFIGFIYGIISQDHDLEYIFLDSFLKLANLEVSEITHTIDLLEKIADKNNINITLSISANTEDLPISIRDKVVLSL